MNPPHPPAPAPTHTPAHAKRLLRLLAAAAFLIFFQAFMIAPILPALGRALSSSTGTLALAVPAYLIPYGAATLLWGPLSDRIGRTRMILGSMTAFVALTAALAGSAGWFITARVVTALGASGVVPIALALLGDLFPYSRRGHALGWLFGAMAGRMAVGSTAGVLLEPVVGWQGLFLAVAVAAVAVLALLWARREQLAVGQCGTARPWRAAAAGYLGLVRDGRAARTYTYVVINPALHSGIYTWLGVYFHQRYGLDEIGIGLALLGYGIPGFVLGPLIGRLADRYGGTGDDGPVSTRYSVQFSERGHDGRVTISERIEAARRGRRVLARVSRAAWRLDQANGNGRGRWSRPAPRGSRSAPWPRRSGCHPHGCITSLPAPAWTP